MTLKYGFNEMDQGGAKAGILGDYSLSDVEKQKLLRRFGEIAIPLLKTRYYITGTDINTTRANIFDMLDHCRIRIPSRRRSKGKKSGYFSALSVMVSTEAAASQKELNLRDCTLAIEGFGAVGSSYAKLMHENWGARILAISTIKGAIYNEDGLDVGLLLELKKKYGDDLINHYSSAERIDHKMLFELEVDILSPCAGSFSIDDSIASKIKASIVCPGANQPVTSAAEKILFEREIISIPAFISNGGGVLGNKMEMTCVSDNFIKEFMRKRNIPQILRFIEKSNQLQIPMFRIAEEEALLKFQKMKSGDKGKFLQKLFYGFSKRIVNTGLLPEFVLRQVGMRYYNRLINRGQ
jgi:glutamate dehydrogenase/leucine dehydrogenase